MPPKRTADSSSGQKRKRETKAEKLAKVQAEWAEKKKKKKEMEANEHVDAEDEGTPAKKAKVSSPGEDKSTGGRRKNASSVPTRSSSRRKDPPEVAKTPPRSTAASKKTQPDRSLFSPNPTGSGSKAAPKEEEDEEDEVIPPPMPLPELPSEKSTNKGESTTLLPALAKKEGSPKTEEEGRAAAAAVVAGKAGDDIDEDDEDYDYHSDSSYDELDDESHELQMQLDQLQRQDDQRLEVPVPRKKSMFWFVAEFAVTFGLFVSVVFYMFPSARALLPSLWEPGPAPTVCFYDSPHSHHEHPVKTVGACRDDAETAVVWQNCPTDARCRGGSLLACPEGFAVSPEGCILTDASNESLDAMIRLLQAWTAQDICKGHPERYEEYGFGGSPLFHYSRVTGELELGYNLGLVQHANNSRFLLKSFENGDLWIGLHPTVHVPLSYLCHFKRLVYGVLGIMGYLSYLTLYVIVGGLLKLLFDSLLEEPLLVGGGMICVTVVGSLVWRKHMEKRARILVENDIVHCRELAWKILSDDPSKVFQMNVLVEKVQWIAYPMSRSGRKRVARIVMPRIAEDFRSDSRIKNIRCLEKGKPVDAWQWKESADTPSGLSGQ